MEFLLGKQKSMFIYLFLSFSLSLFNLINMSKNSNRQNNKWNNLYSGELTPFTDRLYYGKAAECEPIVALRNYCVIIICVGRMSDIMMKCGRTGILTKNIYIMDLK